MCGEPCLSSLPSLFSFETFLWPQGTSFPSQTSGSLPPLFFASGTPRPPGRSPCPSCGAWSGPAQDGPHPQEGHHPQPHPHPQEGPHPRRTLTPRRALTPRRTLTLRRARSPFLAAQSPPVIPLPWTSFSLLTRSMNKSLSL